MLRKPLFLFFLPCVWHLLLPAMFVRDLDVVKQQWTMSVKSASFNPSGGLWHLLCHANNALRMWVFLFSFKFQLNAQKQFNSTVSPHTQHQLTLNGCFSFLSTFLFFSNASDWLQWHVLFYDISPPPGLGCTCTGEWLHEKYVLKYGDFLCTARELW